MNLLKKLIAGGVGYPLFLVGLIGFGMSIICLLSAITGNYDASATAEAQSRHVPNFFVYTVLFLLPVLIGYKLIRFSNRAESPTSQPPPIPTTNGLPMHAPKTKVPTDAEGIARIAAIFTAIKKGGNSEKCTRDLADALRAKVICHGCSTSFAINDGLLRGEHPDYIVIWKIVCPKCKKESMITIGR